MITCIIVDDEPRNVTILEKMLTRYCPNVSVTGQAASAAAAVTLIQQVRPQLVFLDIEMPKDNAFDLLDALMPVDFEIIFVTAFDNYAIKAFKYHALDYLLKPIDIGELQQAVLKAAARLQERGINERLQQFYDQSRNSNFSKIALRTQEGLLFYAMDDILYCSAEGAYTRFGFLKDKSLLVSGHLKKFEDMLPADNFCRVHDSHLINLNHVKKYHTGKGGYVEMADGKIIEVSMRKRAEFLSRLRY